MKKIGFSAMRRVGGAIFPSANVAIDLANAAIDSMCDQGDEAVRIAPFKNRDADQHGAGRYGIAQSRDNDEVVEAQFLLAKQGHLSFSDIDGCIGSGTLSAIESWESREGVNFYTGEPISVDEPSAPPQPQGELVMLTPAVRHTSQTAPGVGEIEIPGLAPDGKTPLNRPVSQIGCASCGLASVWDFYSDDEWGFSDAIGAFISRDCYTKNRDLIWGDAVSVISEHCGRMLEHHETSRDDAIAAILSGCPRAVPCGARSLGCGCGV